MPIPLTTLRLGAARMHRSGDPAAIRTRSAYLLRAVVSGEVEHTDGAEVAVDGAGAVRLSRAAAPGLDRPLGEAELIVIELRRGDLPKGWEPMLLGASRAAAAGPVTRALIAMALGVFDTPPVPRSDEAYRLERILLPLAVAALEPEPSAEPRDPDPSELLHGTVLRIIDERLRDPELSLATLAAEAGRTPRTLQRALQAHGSSASELIRDRRLDALAAELRAPSSEGVRVLASRYGFDSAHYVARAFRQRFGCSMSSYRARHDG